MKQNKIIRQVTFAHPSLSPTNLLSARSKIENCGEKMEDKWKELDTTNWDFKDANTQYLTHKYHSYPARFIPQIPARFIDLFTKKSDTVADPMCGCGTTLVESVLAGRNAVGIEINPLARLISKVKTNPIPSRDLKQLKNLVEEVKATINKERKVKTLDEFLDSDIKKFVNHQEIIENLQRPARKIGEKFIEPIENELAIIKAYLDTIENKDLRDFSYVGLSSTVRTIVEAENLTDRPYEIFKRKILSMIKTMKNFNSKVNQKSVATVYEADARSLPVDSNSVDLIVTSPPYVNALDYYREHQYNMMWLGMDYKKFSEKEMGGHSHFVTNRWRLLSEYLADMFRSISEMKRILKEGSCCAIVIGNSTIEYEVIESYKYFVEIGARINFPKKRVYAREIDASSKYTSKSIGNINDEFICVFEKQGDGSKINMRKREIQNFVKEKLKAMKVRIRKTPGTAVKRKKVSKKRLLQNLDKIDEALANMKKDISMKES